MKKLFLITLLSALFFSCEDDVVTPLLEVDKSELTYMPNGGETIINVDTNISNWYFSIQNEDSEWLKAEKKDASITLNVEPYYSGTGVRHSTVRFYAGDVMKQLMISQASANDALTLSETNFNVEDEGDTIEVKVNHFIEYGVHVSDTIDWISLIAQDDLGTNAKLIKFKVNPNHVRSPRSAIISVVGSGEYSEIKRQITINQAEYVPVYSKLNIVSGETSSYQNDNSVIENAFDDDLGTIWHSKWDNSSADYFPITAQFNFESATNVDRMKYTPNQTSNDNGRFKDIEIWAIPADNTKQPYVIVSQLLTSTQEPTTIDFPETAENLKAIKLNILDGYGDGQGFAAAAEIEFYKID